MKKKILLGGLLMSALGVGSYIGAKKYKEIQDEELFSDKKEGFTKLVKILEDYTRLSDEQKEFWALVESKGITLDDFNKYLTLDETKEHLGISHETSKLQLTTYKKLTEKFMELREICESIEFPFMSIYDYENIIKHKNNLPKIYKLLQSREVKLNHSFKDYLEGVDIEDNTNTTTEPKVDIKDFINLMENSKSNCMNESCYCDGSCNK